MKELPTFGGTYGIATSINDAGQITGNAEYPDHRGPRFRADPMPVKQWALQMFTAPSTTTTGSCTTLRGCTT